MTDKIKFELEFPLHVSPNFLYQYLSTPDGLGEWFADNVNSRSSLFTFIWGDTEEKAKMLPVKDDDIVRFKWLDSDDDTYFEFKIEIDDITKDLSLIVTDFAEDDEIDESKMYWENQISQLKLVIGA
jgi:uncharacterized protein YndB with AHSA1/START domain